MWTYCVEKLENPEKNWTWPMPRQNIFFFKFICHWQFCCFITILTVNLLVKETFSPQSHSECQFKYMLFLLWIRGVTTKQQFLKDGLVMVALKESEHISESEPVDSFGISNHMYTRNRGCESSILFSRWVVLHTGCVRIFKYWNKFPSFSVSFVDYRENKLIPC